MDIHLTADDAPISPKFAKVAVALEKTVLPLLNAFLAYQRFDAAVGDYHRIKTFGHFRSPSPHMQEMLYASLTKNVLLFILIALYGAMLLVSRPPTVLPTKRKHLLV